MGSKFYKSNQTIRKINGKQIHFGSYGLCNQMGKSKSTYNEYCSNYIQISIWIYFD